jgi:hypothetical protein
MKRLDRCWTILEYGGIPSIATITISVGFILRISSLVMSSVFNITSSSVTAFGVSLAHAAAALWMIPL